MKLILLLVVLIAAFTVNCRDFPDGHPKPAIAIEETYLPQVGVDHELSGNGQEGTEDAVDNIVYKRLTKNVKGSKGIKLRGKKDKQTLTKLVDKLESLEYKLTQANLKLNKELQTAMKNITDSNSQLKTDVSNLKQSLTNTNSIILSKLNNISAKQGCQGAGEFLVKSQCFKFFRDTQRSWASALSKCKSENLILAEPTDANAAPLRKYMVDNYGDFQCWLGAKGDGSKFVWQTSRKTLLKDSALWDDGKGSSSCMSTSYCLELDALKGELGNGPSKPYDGCQSCTSSKWTLCEVL